MPWLEGTLYPTNVVPFDVTDRGLMLGDGVFDTSLVLAGRMAWREAHVARLVASAQTLGFAVEAARIDAAIDAMLADVEHGALRITCTRGPGPRGIAPPRSPEPTILASMAPLDPSVLYAPVTLHVTAIRRNDTSPTSHLKCLAYVDAVMAASAARAAGYDDALFLNTRARVACTGVGNFFVIAGDRLVTPPVADGVVPGIARDIVLRTCHTVGLRPTEVSLDLEDVLRADALFVTNSLRLISPVVAVGHHAFRSEPRVTSIAAQIAKMILSETGSDPLQLVRA